MPSTSPELAASGSVVTVETSVGQCPGMSPDAAWAETDELRVAERSNPQIKSYVRPEEAAEKGVEPCSAVTISVGT